MSLSLQERLTAADKGKDRYKPNNEVVRQVARNTQVLGSLVGVTGAGKSYLIPHIIRFGGTDFSEVGNMSSREKRPNDPDDFRGNQAREILLERIQRRELVNYMVHLSGDIYASDIQSYTTRYVVLPTLTSALPQLQRSGCFERIVPIGIVVDGDTWENERLGNNRDSLPRIQEALVCISWLRARLHQIPILENKTGKEEVIAHKIADIMQDPSHPHPLDNTARIEPLLDELAAVANRHLQRLQAI